MGDREAMARAHDVFDPIAQHQLTLPDVDLGRMFGTEGLRIRAKVYAFVAHEGALVVKLPSARVDEWEETGRGERMRMRGNALREWLSVPIDAGPDVWSAVVDEARVFVQSITP